MILIRQSNRDELKIFSEMDRQDHASKFVNKTGLKTHINNFSDPNITYLSIEKISGVLCGYFILVVESGTESVEFRRILIDQSKRGIGQIAISNMESYCRKDLKVKRIWLDVYEDNTIGKHIYEKLGYQQFKVCLVEGRKLLFYEKTL